MILTILSVIAALLVLFGIGLFWAVVWILVVDGVKQHKTKRRILAKWDRVYRNYEETMRYGR